MKTSSRYERQSFLGADAQERLSLIHVGIIGVGGGGSHIVQQLSHIGFQRLSVFDDDIVEEGNLNRLVGGVSKDAKAGRLKVKVAKRVIKWLQPGAHISIFPTRWQQNEWHLRACDLIFACVDSFAARRDLEAVARRYLIPLIDIGIDVHSSAEQGPPSLAGQVILSMPGYPCMQCLGFLSEENLKKEAQQYGAAGPRPQVVWPNGIVASMAVGIAMDLITDWSNSMRGPIYLSYDGNRGLVFQNNRLLVAPKVCRHYPLNTIGAPVFQAL